MSISELRLIMGIEPRTMEGLLPLVSALPLLVTDGPVLPAEIARQEHEITKININTVSPNVLTALFNTQPEAALELIAARPFKNMQMVTQNLSHLQDEELTPSVINEWLDVKSEYFMIESKASFRNYDATWYTVVYRTPEKKIEVLYRMRGVY